MLAATIKKQPRRRRNRDDPVVPFELEIIEALEALLYTKPQKPVNTWGFHLPSASSSVRASAGHALTNFVMVAGLELAVASAAEFPWAQQ